MLQQTLAVFLVLGLLLAALWILRRSGWAASTVAVSRGWFANSSKEKRLCLVERLALTPQHTLHLVSLEGQFILLATSPAGCQAVESHSLGPAASPKSAIDFKTGVAC